MASQVPVLSSNAGGLPEINIDGVTGYSSPVGDVDQMAAHAIAILKDGDLLAQLRKGALEQASRFHIDNIIPQYEALYDAVLQQALVK
jgi:glycosyltransferase involved in cell wall biosynthesis